MHKEICIHTEGVLSAYSRAASTTYCDVPQDFYAFLQIDLIHMRIICSTNLHRDSRMDLCQIALNFNM